MLLAEPPRTQWDLNFSVLGFPVRIHPLFWLISLLLGAGGGEVDPTFTLTVVLVFFVSILIHELGHALMIRRYGRDAYIVLYAMGGLAIEGSSDRYGGGYYQPRAGRRTAQEQTYISLAGPGAQLILAGILLVFAKLMGGEPHLYMHHDVMPMVNVKVSENITPQLATLLFIAFQVNIGWALINLLPVYPLDGGQIALQLFQLRDPHGGLVRTLQLSIFTGAAIAVLALVTMRGDGWYPALLFGSLAFSNYMTYSQIHGGGRGW